MKNGLKKETWSYPDPKTTEPQQRKKQRFFEVIPGALTWVTIIGMFLLSWLVPVWMAVFIILFDIYWLYRTVYIATFSIMGYRKLRRWRKINWMHRLESIFKGDKIITELEDELQRLNEIYKKYFSIISLLKPVGQEEYEKNVQNWIPICKEMSRYKCRKEIWQRIVERRNFIKRAKKDLKNQSEFLDWNKVYHAILLPTANEEAEVIEPAIEAIYNSNFPKDKIIILLAMEERELEEKRKKKEKILRDKFGDKFFDFLVTVHEVKDNEMKCKASNATYAAKKLREYLGKKGIPLEHVVLSNFDCDTQAHPEYLAALTYAYVTEPKRLQHAYQPLPMYHNTIWDTVAAVRVVVTGSSFWHMVESMRPERMVTFSSHSESFKTIVDLDYWPVNMISEDSVIYWKGYDYFDGDYKVKPIYLPVSLDAVLGHNYWNTLVNQYKQKRRWAYGIENFPMLARAFWGNKNIVWHRKIRRLFEMIEGHWSWATASLILALLGWLPLILGGERFNETTLAHNLPSITRTLMTAALIGLVVSMFLSFLLLPPRPKKYSRKKYIFMFLQWVLAPFIASFLGAFPAIDAQTRIMLGKYFGEFWVTEKVRK